MSTPDDQADAFRTFGETITEIGMRPLSENRDLNDDEIAAVAFCARNVLSWAASPAGPEAVPQSEPPDPLATVHVVEFTEDGYGLQHPASCRPNLIDCRYNTYLTSLFQSEREPGRYVMTLAGEHAEYTPVEEVEAAAHPDEE
jgi:hypothetical protein